VHCDNAAGRLRRARSLSLRKIQIRLSNHVHPAAAFATAAMLAASAVPAAANVEVGVLRCHVAPSIGYVIASQRTMRCHFRPSAGGPTHHYVGDAGRIGIDLGVTKEGWLVWGVWAPTKEIYRKDLIGTYAGASAGAAVGLGVGANALVGGSNNTIALQPLSGEAAWGSPSRSALPRSRSAKKQANGARRFERKFAGPGTPRAGFALNEHDPFRKRVPTFRDHASKGA
jgi:hypothetical protein